MFGFDVINLVILLAAAISLVLGAFIFFRNRGNPVNIWFSVFILSLAAWSLSMVFYRRALTIEGTLFWVNLLYIAALFIPLSLVVFSVYFPKGERSVNRFILYLLFLPTIFLVISVLIPNAIIKGVEIIPDQEKIIFWGLYYLIYNIYFIVYFTIIYIILFKKYFSSTGIDKIQIKYILFSILIPSILASTFNLILPTFGIFRFNWAGQIFIFMVAVFVVYTIVKHYLMNVKVITTEVFSILIALVLLVDALMAQSWSEFFLKFSIFIGIALFSILLIRAVLNEVRTREKLAQMAQRLKRANIELKKLDKAKSEFISIASHQLRSPLSATKGFLSMILEDFYGPISDQVRDKLKKSLESNERLINLVDNLLNLSRMERGKMEFEFKKVSLEKIVRGVFEELEMQAKNKGLEFVYSPPKGEFLVNVDENKFRQVVLNLIDNAIKYTEKGKVEVSLEDRKDRVIFWVKDTGIGFPPEEQNNLFKRFVRGKKISRIWTKGTGLGLYVARLIIGAHNGRIGAESKGEGKGSHFWFELPLVK